jgi:hypothetical protein
MNFHILLALFCLVWALPAVSAALTVEEILLLKQNGISETTIQMMLQSEIEAQRQSAKGDPMGIKTITRPNGQPAIVYSTGGDAHDRQEAEERLKEERAWEMLRHIIIDTRQTGD